MKQIYLMVVAAAVAATFINCGGKSSERAERKDFIQIGGLRMPAIPDSLKDAESRSAWMTLHYWDWAPLSGRLDSAMLEQAFADWIPVMAATDSATLSAGVERLMSRARQYPAAADYFTWLPEHYLYEPESPLYSETLYEAFLNEQLRHHPDDETLAYRKQMVMKNRPGTKAPDLTLVNPEDEIFTLAGGTGDILLVFHSPDCEECAETIRLLKSDKNIGRRIADGKLRVVLAYPGGDISGWLRQAAELPEGWETGRDVTGTLDDKYEIRATPTIYLLDADLTVILKDRPAAEVLEAVSLR